MKTNAKVLDGTGKSLIQIQHLGVELKGEKIVALADSADIVTLLALPGLYIATDETNDNSAVISVINTAGTLTTGTIATPTGIGPTKDVASKMNVYIEGGVITVQNNTGGPIDATVKVYG